MRATTYRGFTILIRKHPRLGWCARWESIDGQVIRQSFLNDTEKAAKHKAQKMIDAYHGEIDKAQYRTSQAAERTKK